MRFPERETLQRALKNLDIGCLKDGPTVLFLGKHRFSIKEDSHGMIVVTTGRVWKRTCRFSQDELK